MVNNVRNTADLRRMLLDVIDDVRHGNIDSKDAAAISGLASRVLQSAKMDYDVMRSLGTDKTGEIKPVDLLIGENPQEVKKQIASPEQSLREKIKALKAQKKTLGSIQEELNPQTQEERKLISQIFMSINI